MHDLMAVPSSIASLRYLRSEVERAGSGGEIVTHPPPPRSAMWPHQGCAKAGDAEDPQRMEDNVLLPKGH